MRGERAIDVIDNFSGQIHGKLSVVCDEARVNRQRGRDRGDSLALRLRMLRVRGLLRELFRLLQAGERTTAQPRASRAHSAQ